MLSKKINQGKLKVKYILGNHTQTKNYPTPEDVLFEMIRDYCGRTGKILKFTDASLHKKYPSFSEEDIQDFLNIWLKSDIIKEINSTSSYKTYEVIKNPYS